MSDERLKPCPFCGGEAEVITTKTRQGQTSSVRCSKCSCKVTILKPAFYDGDVEKDTVQAWNTRKPMEQIVVRCGKCTYWDKATVNKKGFLICPASGMEIMVDDFCSYGERRSDE